MTPPTDLMSASISGSSLPYRSNKSSISDCLAVPAACERTPSHYCYWLHGKCALVTCLSLLHRFKRRVNHIEHQLPSLDGMSLEPWTRHPRRNMSYYRGTRALMELVTNGETQAKLTKWQKVNRHASGRTNADRHISRVFDKLNEIVIRGLDLVAICGHDEGTRNSSKI